MSLIFVRSEKDANTRSNHKGSFKKRDQEISMVGRDVFRAILAEGLKPEGQFVPEDF